MSENNHWIGQGTKSSKVLSEDYFKEALNLSKNKELSLWDPNFVTYLDNIPNVINKVSKPQMQKNR